MEKITEYLNESIKLELNVSNLYMLFSEKLKSNKEFWYRLSIEEVNHASLLETIKSFFESNVKVEHLLDVEHINELIEFNKLFPVFIKSFSDEPTIEKSKEIGIFIEQSIAETHYQNIMELSTDDKIINIFQQLNKDDKDHFKRINELI